jgi:hypothetical protein
MADSGDKKRADRELWRLSAESRREVESWPKWKQDAAAAIRREPAKLPVTNSSVG